MPKGKKISHEFSHCHYCNGTSFEVMKTVDSHKGKRRKRYCLTPGCGGYFWTIERLESPQRKGNHKYAKAGRSKQDGGDSEG